MASNNFINECKNSANGNRLATITSNNIILNQDNYIQDFTIDDGCYVNGSIIGTTYAKKLNGNLIGSYDVNLVDKDLNVQVGVKYDDETTEYINLGKFKVEKPKDGATDNYSQITAYDDLINKLDTAYQCGLDFSTQKTYLDLFNDLCSNLNLTPKTLTFDNCNIVIGANPFTNGESNRVVLESIEKVSCTFAQIDVDNNQIELCWLSQNTNPDYTFELDDYTNLNGGKVVYGPINSLVIKNSQIDDENVSISDSESIAQNGENQLVISEDYLLYTPELRQQAITAIWNKVHNLTYVDCELESYYGKPFLKIGDKIRVKYETTEIVNNEETIVQHQFDTYVLTHTFKYDGSFYSKITSPVLTKQEVATKQDISLGEALRNTKIEVDKQNQKITSVVSSTDDVRAIVIGTYGLTEDTTYQADKNYYILNNNDEYELYIDYTVGDTIPADTIYELTGSKIKELSDNDNKLSKKIDDVNDETIINLKSYTDSKISQSKDEIELSFNTKYTDFTDLNDETNDRIDEIHQYLKYVQSDNSVRLGMSTENMELVLKNNRMAFYDKSSNKEVAYISDNKLYITNAQILTAIQIGNFAFMPRDNGSLSFRKVA